MHIIFATDHAGFALKEQLKAFVLTLGHTVEDMGAHVYDQEDDYPTFIYPAAEKIAAGGSEVRGIVLGGSGQGEAMVANRVSGIRAVVYYGEPKNTEIDEKENNMNIITLSRAHNDANVLSLGARFLSEESAKQVVVLWLSTPFSGDERHMRRVKSIEQSAR